MEESSHDMVNMLTQQIGTMFNLLIQNTNHSYQMLANQMGRIADVFGTRQVRDPDSSNSKCLVVQNVERPNNEGNL